MRNRSLSKFIASIALASSVATPAAMSLATPAGATPVANNSLNVTNDGSSNLYSYSGDTLDIVDSGQVSATGSKSHSLETCFDSVYASLQTGSIKVPGGYTVQYSTNNGATYSTKLPRNTDLVNCVRAVGRLNSGGVVNGKQAYTATGPLLPPTSLGGITLSGGGDGFDVSFDPDYTRIFNVYHHSSPNAIDCHLLSDGSSCWGNPVTLPIGTNHRSTAVVIGPNAYVAGGDGSIGGGFACVVIATGNLCSTSFLKAVDASYVNGGGMSYNNFDGGIAVGTKLFGLNVKNGKLGCIDTSTNAKCAGEPADGFSIGTPPSSLVSNGYIALPGTRTDFVNIGNQIFFTNGAGPDKNGYVGCFDASTLTVCGSFPVAAAGPRLAVLPAAAGLGTNAVCSFGTTATCVDTGGDTVGSWSALNARFASTLYPSNKSEGTGPNVMSTVATQGSRLYWSRGSWDGGQNQSGTVDCWDYGTNAACPNFPITPSTFAQVAPTSNGTTYSVRADPHLPNCIWTNDNYHNILAWNTLTGQNQCQADPAGGGAGQPSKFQDPVSKIIGKQSCDGQPDNAGWVSATVRTKLQPGAKTHLFVSDSSGNPIDGWQDVQATVGAGGLSTYDLSGLDPEVSGSNPTFQIQSTLLKPESKVSITLSVIGSTPQMCLKLSVKASCPSIKAMDAGASLGSDATASIGMNNDDGSGKLSDSVDYTVATPNYYDCGRNPATPSLGAIVGGYHSASFKIANPADWGGFKTQGYTFQVLMDWDWSYSWSLNGDLNQTLSNLPSGYHCFNVQVSTDYGYSGWSRQQCVLIGGDPGQPYFTNVNRANSSLTFYWDPPYDLGGASRAQYLLSVYDANSNLVKTCLTAKWSCTVTGLTNASGYSASVQTVTVYGRSGFDWTLGAPAGPIGQPTNITWSATGDRTQLNLAWNAPLYDSHDALDYYRVCAYDQGSLYDCWVVSDPYLTATGLQPKVRYAFVVFAVSTNGNTKGSPIFYHRGQ